MNVDHAKYITVADVASEHLCMSCGACKVVCPTDAITFRETTGGHVFPLIDEKACTECGECVDVCAGLGFGEWAGRDMPEDPFVGNVIEAFIGRATDERIYANSQSGGIATALLAFALEERGFGGALTAVMEPGNPPRPSAHFARSAEELLNAQKSKYCPVPLLTAFEDVQPEHGPVAMIGTSCHIHGFRNLVESGPANAEATGLTIGLFCDRVMTCAAVDHLIDVSSVKDTHPIAFYFRDKSCSGYPGDVHVHTDGESRVLPPQRRMAVKDFFTPARCRLCFDKLNVLSDISVGDPWGVTGADNVHGETVAILRTPRGSEFFHAALDAGYIAARPVDINEVVAGQNIEAKRRDWAGYCDAWRGMHRTVPDYHASVAPHAGKPGDRPYLRDLQQPLSLDEYPTRNALLDACAKQQRTAALRRLTLNVARKLIPSRVRSLLKRLLKLV